MTEQDRDIICNNLLNNMCQGVDFGVSTRRMKVLAVNEACTKALVKVPGHTGWSCVGGRDYYPGHVYVSKPWVRGCSRYEDAFKVTRETPLTKAKLKELMAKYGCNYTYEGMLELARP